MIKDFAVSAQTMSLYDAFRKEAESRGWIWDASFGGKQYKMSHAHNCVFFSNDFHPGSDKREFAFSNTFFGNPAIPLETNWNDAIALLAQESTTEIITVSLQEIASWKKCDIENVRIKL